MPPYIEREPNDNDVSRYQTIYSRVPGAIAAPTAGLHIDQLLIDQLTASGIQIAYVTLHVGKHIGAPLVLRLELNELRLRLGQSGVADLLRLVLSRVAEDDAQGCALLAHLADEPLPECR